jgi:hypothetical protein
MTRVPKEIITTRTMRDTLLRTRTMIVSEEYNKMVINLKGLITRVIPIKETTRRGDIMVIKKGETTTKMSGVHTATKTGDAIVTKKEGATVTSKTGEGTAEAKEALTATKREGRTVTSRGGRMVPLTGVHTAIETGTEAAKEELTGVELPRGNAAQGWENNRNPSKEVKAEGITVTGAINRSTRAVGSNREAPGRRSKRKNHLSKSSIKRTPIPTHPSA